MERKELVDGKINRLCLCKFFRGMGRMICILDHIFMCYFLLVFGTVRWLRGQRRCLVSNVSQYRFIYDVLEDHITSGDTAIDLEDLSQHITSLASKSQNKVISVQTSKQRNKCPNIKLNHSQNTILIYEPNNDFSSQPHNANDNEGPLKGGKHNGSFEDEYQKICALRPRYSIGDCAAGKFLLDTCVELVRVYIYKIIERLKCHRICFQT